jgi:hypothetical protein
MLEKPEVDAMITKALEELGGKPEVRPTRSRTTHSPSKAT